MPRSKRNKQVELAKTKKRGLEWKKNLFEQIRSCVDSYENVFVFSVNDMRNSKMKNVRDQWKDSRFFIGKNKIMAMALGRSAEEEYKPNLHKIGQQVKGECGLLFSNKSTEEVLSWFRSYSEGDYARSGNTATEDVMLNAGPLPMFTHSLEPYLRQLGLPTSLVKGVIHLVKDHEVCKEGDVLTPETAKILKLLGYQMAEFQITINCVWSQDGSFLQFVENVDTEAKENIKKKKSSSPMKSDKVTVEEMEVEINEESDSDDLEIESVPCVTSPKMDVISSLPVKVLNGDITNTSTPKEKIKEVKEKTPKMEQDSIVIREKEEDIEFYIDTSSVPKKMKMKESLDEEDKTVDDKQEVDRKTDNKQEVDEKTDNKQEVDEKTDNKQEIDEKIDNEQEVDEKIDNEQEVDEKTDNKQEVDEKTDNKQEVDEKTDNKKEKKNKTNNKLEDEKVDNKQKTRKRKVKTVAKQESLLKTPDIANSSHESPVFRELRNRSVKVSRKRNK